MKKSKKAYRSVSKTVENSYYRFTKYYCRAHHIDRKRCYNLQEVMKINNEYPNLKKYFR